MPAHLPPPRPLSTLLLAVLGGLLTDTAFPQRNLWPAAFLGMALLVLALRRDHAWWGFLIGTVWGSAFFLVHLSWTAAAVGPVPWVALSLVQGCYIGVLGAAWVWLRRWPVLASRGWLMVVVWALAWLAVESLRSAWPVGGFAWGRLAFSQTTGPLLRLAAWGGVPLVTMAVAALGALLALVWLALREGRPGVSVVALGCAVLIPVLSVTVPLGTRAEAGTLRVGVVQGNVSNPGLNAFDNAREVINNHVAGTLELAAQAAASGQQLDVVLWPENAADFDPRTDAEAAAAVSQAAQAVGVPILLGTQSYQRDEDGVATARFNDYLVWDPQTGAGPSYSKVHPVPFAEYIPLREVVRPFSSAVDLVTVDMVGGSEPGVLGVAVGTENVTLGIAICFEVAYGELVADAVRQGAELLVIPTNNASFGVTAESEQQLAMAVFRAVEHSRATVQVSTVGVSGIISPNGVVQQRTGLFTAETMVAELPLRTSTTPALWVGPVLQVLGYGGTAIALVLGLVSGLRARAGRGIGGGSARGASATSRTRQQSRRAGAGGVPVGVGRTKNGGAR